MPVDNQFPLWGREGESPADGFEYEGGDQVNEKHLNYLWNASRVQAEDFIDEFQAVYDDLDDLDDYFQDEVDRLDDRVDDTNTDLNDHIDNETDPHGLTNDSLDYVVAYDESIIKDGGVKEIDAAELGNTGDEGEVLTVQSDGSLEWQAPEDEGDIDLIVLEDINEFDDLPDPESIDSPTIGYIASGELADDYIGVFQQ